MELTIREMGISKIRMDDKIWLKFDPQTLNLYDKESGLLIASLKRPEQMPFFVSELLI